MKILFVGDVHTHLYMIRDVQLLDEQYNFDKIIFMGDYCDDWLSTGQNTIDTLNLMFKLKNSNPYKYTFLLGNHELSYLGHPCSGHQYMYELEIEQLLRDNIDNIDIYTNVNIDNNNYVCSHAGFTDNFIQMELGSDYINTLNTWNKDKLNYLDHLALCSYYRGGTSSYSSFIWCDKQELLLSNTKIMPLQIVGHTPVQTINTNENIKFIDTHSTYRDGTPFGDKSYLIWNEKEFINVQVN